MKIFKSGEDFLISIGVDEKTAAHDACKIEQAISDDSFEKLKRSIKTNTT